MNGEITGKPELLERWREWQGAIDCGHTQAVWAAANLRRLSGDFARTLAQAGLREGECVALVLANTVAFPIAFMAVLELGCNPVLVFAGTQQKELTRILSQFAIKWAIHDFLPGVSRISTKSYPPKAFLTLANMGLSVLSTASSIAEGPFVFPGRGVALHATSGTYGAPQLCARNQTVAVAEGVNYTTTIERYRGVRITVTTPLSHAYAFGFGMISAILTDSTLVLHPTFNPKRILRLEKERPSDILTIVPPMAKSLASLARSDARRAIAPTVFFAGAPCSPALAEDFEATFTSTLFAIYGTTETGAISTSWTRESKFPGVGAALKNVDVCIRNQEHYEELGEGVGEVFVRSTSMMQGYAAQASTYQPIDYWKTGDLGFWDTAGNLTLVGRIRDVINVGGVKVDPAQVEHVLISHEAIADAAVYPGIRDDGGEFVQAAIQDTGHGLDLEAIRAHCLRQLDSYKVPVTYHIVSRIPRTPSGKCMKIHCPGFPESLITR